MRSCIYLFVKHVENIAVVILSDTCYFDKKRMFEKKIKQLIVFCWLSKTEFILKVHLTLWNAGSNFFYQKNYLTARLIKLKVRKLQCCQPTRKCKFNVSSSIRHTINRYLILSYIAWDICYRHTKIKQCTMKYHTNCEMQMSSMLMHFANN